MSFIQHSQTQIGNRLLSVQDSELYLCGFSKICSFSIGVVLLGNCSRWLKLSVWSASRAFPCCACPVQEEAVRSMFCSLPRCALCTVQWLPRFGGFPQHPPGAPTLPHHTILKQPHKLKKQPHWNSTILEHYAATQPVPEPHNHHSGKHLLKCGHFQTEFCQTLLVTYFCRRNEQIL